MYPQFYEIVSADPTVSGYVSNRIFAAGQAEQDTAVPFVTWQVVNGVPENNLSSTPDIDSFSIQVDVYSDDHAEARNIAEAIRGAIEGYCHITNYRGEGIDPPTQLYTQGFDVDWWKSRA